MYPRSVPLPFPLNSDAVGLLPADSHPELRSTDLNPHQSLLANFQESPNLENYLNGRSNKQTQQKESFQEATAKGNLK